MPAIQAWVRSASGLADGVVFWERQRGPNVEGSHITLDIQSMRGVGDDWRKTEDNPDFDEEDPETAGQELVRKVQGHRTAVLLIEAFADGIGAASGLALLADVVAALPLHEYDLDNAGVGIGGISEIRYAAGVRNGALLPRAQVEVTLHLASEVSDYVTYIERIIATVRAQNTEGTDLGDAVVDVTLTS